jgi:hypothetical protein
MLEAMHKLCNIFIMHKHCLCIAYALPEGLPEGLLEALDGFLELSL